MAITQILAENASPSVLDAWEAASGFLEDPGVYTATVGIGNLEGSEEIAAAWIVQEETVWSHQFPTPAPESGVPTMPASTGESAIALPPLVLATGQIGGLVLRQTGGTLRQFFVVINRIT